MAKPAGSTNRSAAVPTGPKALTGKKLEAGMRAHRLGQIAAAKNAKPMSKAQSDKWWKGAAKKGLTIPYVGPKKKNASKKAAAAKTGTVTVTRRTSTAHSPNAGPNRNTATTDYPVGVRKRVLKKKVRKPYS